MFIHNFAVSWLWQSTSTESIR